MKNFKKSSKYLWIWTLVLGITIILNSCKKDEEPILLGGVITDLYVRVMDTSGNDLVEKWHHSASEKKATEAEYVNLTAYPKKYVGGLRCFQSSKDDIFYFQHGYILDLIGVGDSVSWHFKMYEDDAESLLFEGLCKPYSGPSESNLGRLIQWRFRGVDLPMANFKYVTLIRTEDGRYTLKQ